VGLLQHNEEMAVAVLSADDLTSTGFLSGASALSHKA
jgi:hypothetical protein